MTITPLGLPNRLDPISNITGFTYRTGSTYQEILMRLSEYMQTTLPDEFNGSLGKLFNDVNDISLDWEARFTELLAGIESELSTLSDAAVAGLINTPDSAIRTALDALYSVNDAAVAGLLNTPTSATRVKLDELYKLDNSEVAAFVNAANGPTRAALDALYTDGLAANDGHRYGFIAGVLRNDGAGSGYWQPLTETSTHRPVHIDSVVTDSGKIRINYGSLGANMTVSLVAVPDETLGRAGFTMGASVTPSYADIKMSRNMPPVADYVSFDGSQWVSDSGEFSNIWFSGGKIHLEHKAIASDMTYAVSITPRGGQYDYSVSPDASPTGSTFIEIGVRDHTGAYVTTPNTNMRFYLTHGAAKSVGLDPTTINTTTYPLGNIWIFGVMGLPD